MSNRNTHRLNGFIPVSGLEEHERLRRIAIAILRLADDVQAHPWRHIVMLSYQFNDSELVTSSVMFETPDVEEIERMIEEAQAQGTDSG